MLNTCCQVRRCGCSHSPVPGHLQADAAPGARDAEELIEVQQYDLAELQALMVSGHMLLPSVATCFMALERLKNMGHLP